MQLLSEDEYEEAQERYGQGFTAGMGAEAIRTLLENLNLDEMAAELRLQMIEKGNKKNGFSDKRLLKRIKIVEDFRSSGNKPEWMILTVIPVIPPDLRPMVQLDGGRFATSDLNDLYRRLINRNNRLRRLLSLNAPEIIIRNEKRMLQEAIDSLFDNSKRRRVVKGASNRPLKSLSDMLKGKQGRFRQNLLGKRVDYSGRSVITVGPNLKMWQCGLPTKMALELFKPFIMKKLVDKDVVYNIKKAKQMVEEEKPEVFAVLDEVVKEHPVLLNRAPTLHRLGIQAFEPVLVEGKAIRLNPLVCHAFNADFDGDQMAIHVPLTQAAQMECWTLMLSARNILNPADGKTIVIPSQDMVLGLYYLSKIKPDGKGHGHYYSSPDEVHMAVDAGSLDWEATVKIKASTIDKTVIWDKVGHDWELPKDGYIETTAGRLRMNEELPRDVPYINYQLADKPIQALIEAVYARNGAWTTVKLLDAIKATGYKYSTIFGATIGVNDIIVPEEKHQMIEDANHQVETIQKQWRQGHITNEERYNRVIEVWQKTNESLSKILMDTLRKDQDGFNSIYMMADSGARGSPRQISQVGAMRGLMSKPNGDIIELPIRSNFKEGLSIIEFFISTNGSRKGLADTALKTSTAGYMTRRLVDVAQDVVVNEEDCGTINGISYSAIKNGEDIVEPLRDRIVGRYTLEPVQHPINKEVIVDADEEITEELARKIEEAGVESVRIRTVFTCDSKHGVCAKCYGRNLANNRPVDIGEAVGTVAAQSIGQPGTQLTLRTFHSGGVASNTAEENRIFMKYPIYIRDITGTHVVLENKHWLFTRKGFMYINRVFEHYSPEEGDTLLVEDNTRISRGTAVLSRASGEQIVAKEHANVMVRVNAEGKSTVYLLGQEQKVEIRNGSEMMARAGDLVEAGKTIATFDPFSDPIIAEASGTVKYDDIIPGTTLREELDQETGNVEKQISEFQIESKQPRIFLVDDEGNEVANYFLPGGAYLQVEEDEKIRAGKIIAKTLNESAKSIDITSGLPRVSELFEARRPKNPSVLAEVSGVVHFKGISKSKRIIIVEDIFGKEFKHLIPMSKRLLVRDGDTVEAGAPLCVGAIDAHDILRILGETALQRYLMDEIQKVYRLQGVSINDKHIGVIVRQMLRRVEIVAVGDTRFIFGQMVDKYTFKEENERVMAEGGQAAVARPLFQGITRASLAIDSFLSAASFQETTKVLTNAAISGSTDYLRGLKENIIIGHPIPAGTGMKRYRNMKLYDQSNQDLDEQMNQILEYRRELKEAEDRANEELVRQQAEAEAAEEAEALMQS
jgi:DNA-directed RNA polymerase subunit beta'